MRGLTLPDDVVCYIAAKVENNTRELEGAITKIQGMSLLQDGQIDLELAKAALGETRDAGAEADHDPADLRRRDEVLQRAAERPAEQEAPQEHRVPAAGLHVPRPPAHALQPGRDRRLLRRPRPHDGAARRPHGRRRHARTTARSPSRSRTSTGSWLGAEHYSVGGLDTP